MKIKRDNISKENSLKSVSSLSLYVLVTRTSNVVSLAGMRPPTWDSSSHEGLKFPSLPLRWAPDTSRKLPESHLLLWVPERERKVPSYSVFEETVTQISWLLTRRSQEFERYRWIWHQPANSPPHAPCLQIDPCQVPIGGELYYKKYFQLTLKEETSFTLVSRH